MDLSEKIAGIYFTPESADQTDLGARDANSSHDVLSSTDDNEGDIEDDGDDSEYGTQDRVAEFRLNMPSSGITLFSHRSAPNGFKVAVVMSELGLDYHTFNIDLQKHEERLPSYVELNPNARIPTIIDHENDNFALWESGAILEYICRRPQTMAKSPEMAKQLLGGESLQQQALVNAWVHFQASGHAPIIGHALQFRFVEANVPSTGMAVVADRFIAEARRVAGVLEVYLAEKRELLVEEMSDDDTDSLQRPIWLVGNSMTLADLAFVPWNQVFPKLGINLEEDYPEVRKWTENIMTRPRVLAALGIRSS